MLVLLLYSVFLCSCVFLILNYYVRELRAHKLPPKAWGQLPVVGITQLVILYNQRLWYLVKLLAEDCVKKGGVTYCTVATRVYYFITDPEDALTVANACPQKHYAYRVLKAWLGDGLITSSAEASKRHRKLLAPAFSQRVVNDFIGVFNNQARELTKDLTVYVDKGPFDQNVGLRTKALETFCTAVFGMNGHEDKNFILKYMDTVDDILNVITQRIKKFYYQSDLIYSLFGLKKIQDQAKETLNSMAQGVIQMKKAKMMKNVTSLNSNQEFYGLKFKPLLDLLLELADEDALNDQELREEIDTAIMTSFDTTSNAMVFITMVLGAYPDVQEKLYKELLEILGPDRDVVKEDLQKLVYTEAVIKETLRLYPIGPALLRYVDKDVKLKNCTMRQGTNCIISPYGMHIHPVWGPDASEFRPERWLHSDSLPENPNAFGGFSLGKRSCLGKPYAMMSMKVTLAHFLRKYKILHLDLSKVRFSLDFLLKPCEGYEISIALRN